jgi:hypothetical protein
LTSEIPHIFGPKYLSKHKCEKGCEGTFANSPYEDTISARHVELHDTETSNDPPIMNGSNENTNTITKPKISNEGVNPDVTNVTKVTKSGKRSEIPKIADKAALEDHEAYIARQTEKVRATEKEEQQSTARKIFDELVLKNTEIGMEKEVLESKFREELASREFSEHDINIIIKDMENGGFVERVATESGVIHDILRKR